MAPPRNESVPAEPDTRAVAAPGVAAADATLSDALTTIRKRRYAVAAVLVLGILFGLYEGATQVRLYKSTARIEIRSGSANQYRIAGSPVFQESNYRIPTEVDIIKSDTILYTVARDLDLANNADFLGVKKTSQHADIDVPAVRENIVKRLQSALTVTSIPKTELIEIDCETLNPKLSADIVNTLINVYLTRSFESRVESTNRASGFLTKQLDDLKREVESSQENMIDLGKQLGVLAIDPSHNQITSYLDELTTATGTAQVQRILAESRYRVLSGMDRGAVDQSVASINAVPGGTAVGDSSTLTQLRVQRDVAQANFAKLSANLGPNNPQVKAVAAELKQLNAAVQQEESRIISQAKQTYIAAQADEDQTRAALEAEKSSAYKLRDNLVEYTIASRDFESNRTLYEGLLQRLRTAGIQAGLEATEIDVIDQAIPASSPTLKSRSSILILDTAVALVLGIILAFLLESLDTGLRGVAEIESVSGLPSLALIPRIRRTGVDTSGHSAAERNLALLSNPRSQFAEAFRSLRTSLLLSTAGKLPEVILLTSATPSEGKTTVSLNLACVLAQRNVRVLMIDADLRRPTIHHRLALNGKVGLTSVLTGTLTLEEAVQRVPEIPNLDILVSGPIPPFPTEMLSSDTMVKLLEHCRGIYTHIVIDSPPLLSVTDGVVLARDADAVVLIVRHGKSTKHAVRRARDLLLRSGAPVTGIAINAVDLSSPEYYGYYGYAGYTGYGSSGVDATGWESQSGESSRSKGKGDLS